MCLVSSSLVPCVRLFHFALVMNERRDHFISYTFNCTQLSPRKDKKSKEAKATNSLQADTNGKRTLDLTGRVSLWVVPVTLGHGLNYPWQ